jgi:hypothetical protein
MELPLHMLPLRWYLFMSFTFTSETYSAVP